MAHPRKAILAAAALAILTQVAHAHGGAEIDGDELWRAWEITPDIVIATGLVLAVYLAGLWRRRSALYGMQAARSTGFLSGVALLFLALQSPVDPMAEHLFWMHQIQHLLLRDIGPFLIAWSLPGAMLVAGLPRSVRTPVLAPLFSNSGFLGFFRILGTPVVATLLFVTALYFWQVPAFHDAALLNDPLHYTMHVTMLAAGLLFWARIFDPRPAPKGIRYGVRLMMLWVAILANIVLGAAMTLKPTVLYHAYDIQGRLFDFPPVADEQLGGMLIWIPGSMMGLLGVLIVIHAFGRHETRMEEARARNGDAAADVPTTGAELVARAGTRNKQFAIGFAGFSLAIFVMAIVISALSLDFGPRTSGGTRMAPLWPSERHHTHTAHAGDTIQQGEPRTLR